MFYGKDDLSKRLERLDEDADLMIDNNDRYQMVIVGGSAFILLGKLTRATHDIDALSVPKELYSLLGKYDLNTDVEAYIYYKCALCQRGGSLRPCRNRDL